MPIGEFIATWGKGILGLIIFILFPPTGIALLAAFLYGLCIRINKKFKQKTF